LVSVLVYFFAAAVYLSMRPADDHSQEVKYLLVSFPIVFFSIRGIKDGRGPPVTEKFHFRHTQESSCYIMSTPRRSSASK